MKAFFGQFAEENNMDSNRVGEFYNDLKLTASEVVHSAMVVRRQNSDEMPRDIVDNTKYRFPLYEMGDCPVFRVPEGLRETSKIV